MLGQSTGCKAFETTFTDRISPRGPAGCVGSSPRPKSDNQPVSEPYNHFNRQITPRERKGRSPVWGCKLSVSFISDKRSRCWEETKCLGVGLQHGPITRGVFASAVHGEPCPHCKIQLRELTRFCRRGCATCPISPGDCDICLRGLPTAPHLNPCLHPPFFPRQSAGSF